MTMKKQVIMKVKVGYQPVLPIPILGADKYYVKDGWVYYYKDTK